MVITYPTRTIIIPTLSIRSENVDIKMQFRDTYFCIHTGPYLKSLSLSTTFTKFKRKFHLHLSDSCHQKNKKYVTWGLKWQKFYVYFTRNQMEPFTGGVRPKL